MGMETKNKKGLHLKLLEYLVGLWFHIIKEFHLKMVKPWTSAPPLAMPLGVPVVTTGSILKPQIP